MHQTSSLQLPYRPSARIATTTSPTFKDLFPQLQDPRIPSIAIHTPPTSTMPTIKSPRLRSAALASLAASVMIHPPAAASPINGPNGFGLSTQGAPDPYNLTGWPQWQEPTFIPAKIAAGGPPNAILFTGTDFMPLPTEWLQFHNTTDRMLPASCYNCNPKGCMCSAASLKSAQGDNGTDTGMLINRCEVCRDSPSGMVCYCSESQLTATTMCEEPVDPKSVDPKLGNVCRLNEIPAGMTVMDIVEGGKGNGSENMLVGSGGSKKVVRSAAAVAGAALGTAAAMFL